MVKKVQSLKFSVLPCDLEGCEDLFDQAKELEGHSPILIQAAKNYSEIPHCIPLRTRVQCLKRQEKQCGQHFNFHAQVVGLSQIMDVLGCSNDTMAAVFNPNTMGMSTFILCI